VPAALVTGATGLVGWHVAKQLHGDGWDVRALVREESPSALVGREWLALAVGDILDPASFARAARGCDVVFHAAAAVTPDGGWEAFRRPNVDGTSNAIAAAAESGARLVQVSSVAVYGGAARYASGSGAIREDTPFAPIGDHAFYARSKRESERLVLEAHAAGRLWATAVRPCVVYGRHDRQFVPRLARMLGHGIAPVIGGGHSILAVVHAANVADGIVRAAAHERAGGRAFNLANDHAVSVADFFRLAGEGLGARLRTVPIPTAIARVAVRAAALVAPRRLRAATSAAADFLTRDNPFDSSRARRNLGWDPPVRPEEGVLDAFRWWAAQRR
jgi:nucleoside-diphosphate-sugar epimerase